MLESIVREKYKHTYFKDTEDWMRRALIDMGLWDKLTKIDEIKIEYDW